MIDIFKIVDNITPLRDIESIRVFKNKLDHTPFFTIAIPTYKRAGLLKEAIDSALNQEGFEELNVNVCDKNPERNDETEMLMKLYKDNPKVTYYKHTQNVGMAGNWNKCALLSDSDKIVLLHDDDIIYPNALKIMCSCLSFMKNDWSLLKPELDKFVTIDQISKKEGSSLSLHKLSRINFYESCPVGAPSCILINRSKLISIGGVDAKRYPCIDYEMSLKLSEKGDAYLLEGDMSLGGYRVANNESLSEKTMDNYFVQRSLLSTQLMKQCGISQFVIDILDDRFEMNSFRIAKRYYNMPAYQLKTKKNAYGKHIYISKLILKIYSLFLYIINDMNTKSVQL